MSVRKRKWRTSKGEVKEAWIVDYVDQTGERRFKNFTRKKEADEYHAQVKVDVRRGVHTPESQSLTIAEAGERWLAKTESLGRERTTLDQYRQHLRDHIVPYLGRQKLCHLTAAAVSDFETNLREGNPAPGQHKSMPRSPALTKKILGSLGSLIAQAQADSLVAQNVVRLRGRRRHSSELREKGRLQAGVDFPTPQEVSRIIANLPSMTRAVPTRKQKPPRIVPVPWRPLILTAIFTGLRASELRGLRWVDVDFNRKVNGNRSPAIYVRQRADRYNKIGPPKSKSGERTVPIPPIVENTLKEWKLACPKGPLDLVFPNGKGRIESHANIVNRGLVPVQIAAGVTVPTAKVDDKGQPVRTAKYPGLHTLRHFYASWCINRKADGGLELPPKAAQERLGHKSIVMTLDVYGHLFPTGDDGNELAAAEAMLLAR